MAFFSAVYRRCAPARRPDRRLLVDIAAAQAEVDAALLALDVQAAGAGKGGRQRLRAAHAAQAGGEDPAARPGCRRSAACRLRQRSRRCPARCPGCRCRSSCRRSSGRTSSGPCGRAREVFPGGPLGHQVAELASSTRGASAWVRNTPTGLPLCTSRVSSGRSWRRLFEDGLEAVPVARGLADAAVDHQRVGVFGHLGVQVVLQHAVGGFDQPVGAAAVALPRGARTGCGWAARWRRTGRSWRRPVAVTGVFQRGTVLV
jgi:hypothetical protein